jgi:homospermidine synthase
MNVLDTRFVLIGFGSVAQGLAPLMVNSLGIPRGHITAIAADTKGQEIAAKFGIHHICCAITEHNYVEVLEQYLSPGSVLLNLAYEVSSVDLILWCQAHDVLYLDTCIEPWSTGYDRQIQPIEKTTNAWLRNQALLFQLANSPTAVIAHGANPGLISHLLKEALLALATVQNVPIEGMGWAELAQKLNIQVIQIAERDTQLDISHLAEGEFSCTWSPHGFLTELQQPVELGWGSHETQLPAAASTQGCASTPSLFWEHTGNHPALVKSWTPSGGFQDALLITHHESISIADFLTIHGETGALYRPTVYYAYQPSPKTLTSVQAWLGSSRQPPDTLSIQGPEQVLLGADQLGVLLIHPGGAFWYGTTLDIFAAKSMAPHNTATSLQVAAGILGALVWMLENPRKGVIEAEYMDSQRVLEVAKPFLGLIHGETLTWPDRQNSLCIQHFLVKEDEH